MQMISNKATNTTWTFWYTLRYVQFFVLVLSSLYHRCIDLSVCTWIDICKHLTVLLKFIL